MLNHAKGNVLDMAEAGQFSVVVQGCNCFNMMGAGIAREIRERYPHIADVDSRTIRGDYNKLGTYTKGIVVVDDFKQFTIINAYTQFSTSNTKDVFEYLAFEMVLQKIAATYGYHDIGLPYIGMGLAGGDKNRIIPMIEKFAEEVHSKGGTVTLVEFA